MALVNQSSLISHGWASRHGWALYFKNGFQQHGWAVHFKKPQTEPNQNLKQAVKI
jgi:hypothetical protein